MTPPTTSDEVAAQKRLSPSGEASSLAVCCVTPPRRAYEHASSSRLASSSNLRLPVCPLFSETSVKHIARLARLYFTDQELRHFESQVAEILRYVEQLKEVAVEGVGPTSHPLSLANVFREDTPCPPLSVENFLKQAPSTRSRFFQVPKVIGNE